jgi:hypothetical protein
MYFKQRRMDNDRSENYQGAREAEVSEEEWEDGKGSPRSVSSL